MLDRGLLEGAADVRHAIYNVNAVCKSITVAAYFIIYVCVDCGTKYRRHNRNLLSLTNTCRHEL